ncbi:unnamed protein product [Cylindrotheca closterium]|uniref:D,D-heptose 1,7-bisphosphate phosphatase n=1 Tax=Cylindrotheca closterium TaxID=2856 RepID=A0AAD2FUN6_9STRA|nr:unnamed protein product [Cylindrotheca closterium]
MALLSISIQALARFPVPKLVLLDRDGVINQDVGAPGVISKTQFQLHDGVGTAIAKLKQRGCRVVVITNQSCVGMGLLEPNGLNEIHEEMQRLLQEEDAEATLDEIYFCTAVDDDNPRKKPNPGMVIEACSNWNIDASEAVFVGDTLTDMQAAKAGGVANRILVQTGYGFGLMGNQPAQSPPMIVKANNLVESQSQMSIVTPFADTQDLPAAVQWLLHETDT